MAYKCPYDNCTFEAQTVWGLKLHVKRKHPLNGECPVCGERKRMLLRHMLQKRDLAHEYYYWLYADWRRKPNDVKKKFNELYSRL